MVFLLLLLLHFEKLWVPKSYGTFLRVIVLRYHGSLGRGLLRALGLRRTTQLLPAGGDTATSAPRHTRICSLKDLLPLSIFSFPGTLPHCLLILPVCSTPCFPNRRESVSGGFIYDRGKTAFMLYCFLKSMASLPLRA